MKTQLNSSRICITLFLLVLTACSNKTEPKMATETPSIWGSWEIQAIHWITKDTTYNINKAQPGLFMIDEARYAIMWTPTQAPRQPFKVLAQPTDAELKNGFRSIVFNSGSYQMNDSMLTTQAQIAKVPGFEGGKQFYRYTIQADTLQLTMFDETYPDGTKPEWYGKVQTQFVLIRL
ncbi:MAG: lipocalin-like domain-containing protein [Bacteroidota bacterium]